MPKPHLRPALAGACLLAAAAPAAGQSLESRIIDAQTALHHVENMRATMREADRQAALAEIGAEQTRREFVEQVRPRCMAYPMSTSAADVDPYVVKKAIPLGLLVCDAFRVVAKEEDERKGSPLDQALRKLESLPK